MDVRHGLDPRRPMDGASRTPNRAFLRKTTDAESPCCATDHGAPTEAPEISITGPPPLLSHSEPPELVAITSKSESCSSACPSTVHTHPEEVFFQQLGRLDDSKHERTQIEGSSIRSSSAETESRATFQLPPADTSDWNIYSSRDATPTAWPLPSGTGASEDRKNLLSLLFDDPLEDDAQTAHKDPGTSSGVSAMATLDTGSNSSSSQNVADLGDDGLSVNDDDGYESDRGSSASESITSSVWGFSYENGRRYHKFREGIYNFPNDNSEQEREDMKHAMLSLLCDGQLHFAPFHETPQEILDMGTGTGIWAIESKAGVKPKAHGLVG
jgi:hypothetical protein